MSGASTSTAPERRLAAILFTDVMGYTSLMAASEERGLRVRSRHRAVVEPIVVEHQGEMIEARGDECLALFGSAWEAVRCALALRDAATQEADLELHLGIHMADVVRVESEISGDGVNVARRICALSRGDVCVSAEVWQAVRNHTDLLGRSIGPQELKNVGRPVEVFRVGRAGEHVEGATPVAPSSTRRRVLLTVLAGAALCAVLIGLGRERLEPPPAHALSPTGGAPRTSIAVLPFADMSPGRDHEQLADAFAEEILHALAGVEGLRVVARTSSFAFKGRNEDVRSIGEQLAAGSVLEGSLRRGDDRLRVTAQLIDASNGFHLWSSTYDVLFEDVLDVQQEIAASIVRAVQKEVAVDSPATNEAPPRDFQAYQLYLRARGVAMQRSDFAIDDAIRLYEQAIAVDPAYAEAYAGLAHSRILLWDYTSEENRHGPLLGRAEEAVLRALELDPESAFAHAVFGNLRKVRYLDWSGAYRAYERALALNPGLTEIREQYASLLLQTGRLDEAGVEYLRALDADPLNPLLMRSVGRYYMNAGDSVRALDYLWQSLHLNPSEPLTPGLLAWTYLQTGRDDEALDALARRAPWITRPLLRSLGRLLGLPATASLLFRVVRLVEECPGGEHTAAQYYAYLEWREAMYDCLERSLDRDPSYFAVNPIYDAYRAEPRFERVLQRAGLR